MMTVNRSNSRRVITKVLLVMAVPFALLVSILPASAAQMQNRSVVISSAEPSASVRNDFLFDIESIASIASVSFEYCSNSPLLNIACIPPAGLDVSGSTLANQTGNTGFTINGVTTTNKLVISRSSAPAATITSSYRFSGIINPSTPNQTVYVRVTTHASSDATDPYIDEGSVAFSTAITGFGVGAFVPPRLTFCVALVVAPDCSTVGTVLADFGELSASRTATATNQFAVATNDFSGYNVFFDGSTIAAGNSIVNPLTSQAASSVGTSQFGFNLRSNSSPSVGANVSGNGSGQAVGNYNIPNRFVFGKGDLIARSTLSSDFNRFTASFIVNVPDDQPAGVYATTVTYSAVVSF